MYYIRINIEYNYTFAIISSTNDETNNSKRVRIVNQKLLL